MSKILASFLVLGLMASAGASVANAATQTQRNGTEVVAGTPAQAPGASRLHVAMRGSWCGRAARPACHPQA